MSPLQPIVAAILVDALDNPTRFFAAARAYPKELRGQYEFPGGKVEENEHPLHALAREMHEELGICIRIGAEISQEDGQWWPLANGRMMGVWLAEATAGTPTLGSGHLDGRWLPLNDDALEIPWIRADLPIVQAFLRYIHSQAAISTTHQEENPVSQ